MIHSRSALLVRFVVCLFGLQILGTALAAEPDIAAYQPIERKLPPPGNMITYPELIKLVSEYDDTKADFALLSSQKVAANLLSDVEIYTKAVLLAIGNDEFYKTDDLGLARKLLDTARQRGEELAAGKPSWLAKRGQLVRGYRSAIDNSVQPYGLVIPEQLDLSAPVPLYVWLHGRGDKLTDLHFIAERETKPGQIQPQDGIVLHAFGRSCIGYKSAGEIDIFEAIADVSQKYPIDQDRIALMGFSMGGAGAWHVGAHYTDRFAVVHPGAGFVDVRRYLNIASDAMPPWYEQTLWHNYDVPDYVRNLLNVPVIAYSGENDKQKAAADIMEATFAEQGVKMTHLIGPGIGHAYDPEKLKEVMALVQKELKAGRPAHPLRVSLQTRTLRYPRMYWVKVTELIEHWQDTRVDAQLSPDEGLLNVKTLNVRRLQIELLKSKSPTPPNTIEITIDGEQLSIPSSMNLVRLVMNDKWELDTARHDESSSTLVKRPGLQGPIDDVLLEPFLVVTPSGKSAHPAIDRWVEFELNHFLERWRAIYRGEARVKKDKDVTDEDLAKFHVILWGDPRSNSVIRQLTDRLLVGYSNPKFKFPTTAVANLPFSWTSHKIQVGEQSFDAAYHVPLLIYPNPLKPDRYVVLNSGCTHREGHDHTNSLQNPKLPDWAVIDVRTPPSATEPGKVVAADFFDEAWQLKPAKK